MQLQVLKVDIGHVIHNDKDHKYQENDNVFEYFIAALQVYNCFSAKKHLIVCSADRAVYALTPHNMGCFAVGMEDSVRTFARVDEVTLNSKQLQVLFILNLVLPKLLQKFRQKLLLHPQDRVVSFHEEDWSLSLAQFANNVFIVS